MRLRAGRGQRRHRRAQWCHRRELRQFRLGRHVLTGRAGCRQRDQRLAEKKPKLVAEPVLRFMTKE